eukprot:EG_transcript_7142
MHAARPSPLLQQWDRGSRAKRVRLLGQLLAQYAGVKEPALEQSLGPAAMLLFTRLTAWLRLTYQLGYELAVQLHAIALFLPAPRFLASFLEVGGVQTVLDIQAMPQAKEEDKRAALALLLLVARCGRVHREMVCDGAGMGQLVAGCRAEERQPVLDLYAALWRALGQGNPNRSGAVAAALVHVLRDGGVPACIVAAAALRALLTSKQQLSLARETSTLPSISRVHSRGKLLISAGPASRADTADVSTTRMERSVTWSAAPMLEDPESEPLQVLLARMKSANATLRFEATELLILVAEGTAQLSAIVRTLVEVLQEPPSGNTISEGPQSHCWTSAARALGRVLFQGEAGQWDWRKLSPVFHVREEVAEVLEAHGVGLTLLSLFRQADVTDIELQRECAGTLQRIVCCAPRFPTTVPAIRREIGEDIFELLRSAKPLELEDLRALRLSLRPADDPWSDTASSRSGTPDAPLPPVVA